MYIFLLVLGIALLATGLYIERNDIKTNIKPQAKVETGYKIDQDIINRLQALEALVYSPPAEQISQDEFLSVLQREKDQVKIDNLDISDDMKKKFKLIADLERGAYSLEEICQMLDMQKGEVLLLKNFYKKYKE